LAAKCLWNGGRRLFLPTTDWNSRTEQRERPQRDRLIARDVYNGGVLGFIYYLVQYFSLLVILPNYAKKLWVKIYSRRIYLFFFENGNLLWGKNPISVMCCNDPKSVFLYSSTMGVGKL
jgi:hypothetical protein